MLRQLRGSTEGGHPYAKVAKIREGREKVLSVVPFAPFAYGCPCWQGRL
jgi:hypothetical protein